MPNQNENQLSNDKYDRVGNICDVCDDKKVKHKLKNRFESQIL